MLFVFVDQLILTLGSPHTMEIDGLQFVLRRKLAAGPRRWKTSVEKSVARPGKIGEFQPTQVIGQYFSSGDLDNVRFLPIGTALRDRVAKILAIFRDGVSGELRRAVGGKRVGVEEDARGAGHAFLDIQYALILETVVLAVEQIAAAPEGRRVLGIIIEQFTARANLMAVRNLGEIGRGELILGFDPACGFG